MAISAATVIRLRSRCDRPGRAHTWPNSTSSVSWANWGAMSPNSCWPWEGAVEALANTGSGRSWYCVSVTGSSQSAALPFSTSVIAVWVMALSGAAPCQCLVWGGMCTTSPTRISSTGPPQRWMRPTPAVTIRVWPSGWLCQWVRAPGLKLTAPAELRSSPLGTCSISTLTCPVKYCSGAALTGRLPARVICRPAPAAKAASGAAWGVPPAVKRGFMGCSLKGLEVIGALHGDALQHLGDALQVFSAEQQVGSGQVLVQALRLGGAGDRCNPGALGQQPGQGHLGRGGLARCGDVAQGLHQGLVGLACFDAEARHHVAKIIGAEFGLGGDGPGQKALAQGAEGHEADTQLLQQRQDLLLGLAPPQRVFALQGRHGLHGMGPANRLGPGLGQAEVAHLALGDQLFHGAGHVLHRHLGIDPVLVEQVNAVGTQVLERVLDHRSDTLGAAVHTRRDVAVLEAELGGNHHLVTHRRQGLAHHFFVQCAIGLGGVEEGHATLDRLPDQLHCSGAVNTRTVAIAQTHAAHAEGRDLQATAAQLTLFHEASWLVSVQSAWVRMVLTTSRV